MELYGRSGVKNGSRQNLNAGWAPETGFEGGFSFVAFEFEFQFPVVRFLVCIMFFFLGFLDSVHGGVSDDFSFFFLGIAEPTSRLGLWGREAYPERPGATNCVYYLRTGSCGYGAKCRYNHPRDPASVSH